MQRIKSYSELLKLSDNEREKEYSLWDVYIGEGENILKEYFNQQVTKLSTNGTTIVVP